MADGNLKGELNACAAMKVIARDKEESASMFVDVKKKYDPSKNNLSEISTTCLIEKTALEEISIEDGELKNDDEVDVDVRENGGCNLWVSELSSQVKAKDLREFFSIYGEVLAAKVATTAKNSGSRSYGFVTMKTEEEANVCLDKLNKTQLKDKVITIQKEKAYNDKTNQLRLIEDGWHKRITIRSSYHYSKTLKSPVANKKEVSINPCSSAVDKVGKTIASVVLPKVHSSRKERDSFIRSNSNLTSETGRCSEKRCSHSNSRVNRSSSLNKERRDERRANRIPPRSNRVHIYKQRIKMASLIAAKRRNQVIYQRQKSAFIKLQFEKQKLREEKDRLLKESQRIRIENAKLEHCKAQEQQRRLQLLKAEEHRKSMQKRTSDFNSKPKSYYTLPRKTLSSDTLNYKPPFKRPACSPVKERSSIGSNRLPQQSHFRTQGDTDRYSSVASSEKRHPQRFYSDKPSQYAKDSKYGGGASSYSDRKFNHSVNSASSKDRPSKFSPSSSSVDKSRFNHYQRNLPRSHHVSPHFAAATSSNPPQRFFSSTPNAHAYHSSHHQSHFSSNRVDRTSYRPTHSNTNYSFARPQFFNRSKNFHTKNFRDNKKDYHPKRY